MGKRTGGRETEDKREAWAWVEGSSQQSPLGSSQQGFLGSRGLQNQLWVGTSHLPQWSRMGKGCWCHRSHQRTFGSLHKGLGCCTAYTVGTGCMTSQQTLQEMAG